MNSKTPWSLLVTLYFISRFRYIILCSLVLLLFCTFQVVLVLLSYVDKHSSYFVLINVFSFHSRYIHTRTIPSC